MAFELYRDVILTRDIPEERLRAGDVGTLVDRHVVDVAMKSSPLYLIAIFVCACTGPVSPTKSSATPPLAEPAAPRLPAPSVIGLEAEGGSGDGDIRYRSQASGGRTAHLGPGEHRTWTFTSDSSPAEYAIRVRYSNGRYGPHEIITVVVDGVQTRSFEDRDTGEDTPEGWNAFALDDGSTTMLRAGSHTVTLRVTGGDGCVEIDVVTLSPQ